MDIIDLFKKCDRLSQEYFEVFINERVIDGWDIKRVVNYSGGPVRGLLNENDETLYYFLQMYSSNIQIVKDVIFTLYKYDVSEIKTFDELFQLIELSEYFGDLDWKKDEKHVDFFIRLIEKQYKMYLQEEKGKQDKLSRMYGDTIAFSKYGLIPVNKDIEILVLEPPRIYDSAKGKTIILEEKKEIIEVINKIFIQGDIEELSFKGKENEIYDGIVMQESFLEEFEFGTKFSCVIDSLRDVTKLFDDKQYNNQLWIKKGINELTFEEIKSDYDGTEDYVCTQMVHLQYKINENNPFITHIDHEIIYYSYDDYDKRVKDNKMATKGEYKPRKKLFKVDNSRISFTYPCEVINFENKTRTVPFIYFVVYACFENRELVDEYFLDVLK